MKNVKKLSKRDGQIFPNLLGHPSSAYAEALLILYINYHLLKVKKSFLKKNLSKSLMKSVCQNHHIFDKQKLALTGNEPDIMKQKDSEKSPILLLDRLFLI